MGLSETLYFMSYFIWFTAFCLAYQMFHLRFLKWLMWGEILGLVTWFYASRYRFIGYPEITSEEAYHAHHIRMLFDQCIDLIPMIVTTIGAIMGVFYLQDRFKHWKRSHANKRLESAFFGARKK